MNHTVSDVIQIKSQVRNSNLRRNQSRRAKDTECGVYIVLQSPQVSVAVPFPCVVKLTFEALITFTFGIA